MKISFPPDAASRTRKKSEDLRIITGEIIPTFKGACLQMAKG